jgi:hypothetical protein
MHVQAEKRSIRAAVLTRLPFTLVRTAEAEKMLQNLQFKR